MDFSRQKHGSQSKLLKAQTFAFYNQPSRCVYHHSNWNICTNVCPKNYFNFDFQQLRIDFNVLENIANKWLLITNNIKLIVNALTIIFLRDRFFQAARKVTGVMDGWFEETLIVCTRFCDGTLLYKEKKNCANEKLLSPWLA